MAKSGAASENISSLYPYAMDKWGQDTMKLSESISLDSLPIDLTKQQNWAINGLGLGANSTILNRLKSTQKIASSSWSMWYGRYNYGRPADVEMDGTLVLGGYDMAKTVGSRIDFRIEAGTACRTNLVAPLLDVKVNAGGQSTSILDKPQFACLDPGQTTLEASAEVFNRFYALLGGTFLRNSSGLFAAGPVFEAGDS